MIYVYLVYEIKPRYKQKGFVYESTFCHIPKVFISLENAKEYARNYKYTTYTKKVRLR